MGGVFKVKLTLGKGFPQEPPKAFFLTKIFHPNVALNGEICVNTLKKDWKSDLGIKHILLVSSHTFLSIVMCNILIILDNKVSSYCTKCWVCIEWRGWQAVIRTLWWLFHKSKNDDWNTCTGKILYKYVYILSIDNNLITFFNLLFLYISNFQIYKIYQENNNHQWII